MIQLMQKLLHQNSELPMDQYGPFFTHEYIVYYALQSIPWIWDLPSVPIKEEPPVQGWKIGPDHVNLYKEVSKVGNPVTAAESHDCANRNGIFSTITPADVVSEPWKILTLYCTEPDLELDCGINLSPLQSITGGSHGYRHMYFNLFGKNIGTTPQAIQKYQELAIAARDANSYYWMFRYFARELHYIADMGHPFHVKLFPHSHLLSLLLHPKKILQYVSATHNGHEVFTQQQFREGNLAFISALTEGVAEGIQAEVNSFSSFEKLLKKYRKNAISLLSPLYKSITKNFQEVIQIHDLCLIPPDIQKLDVSKQTIFLEQKTLEIIFQNLQNPGLMELQTNTEAALKNVGCAYGWFFNLNQKTMQKF